VRGYILDAAGEPVEELDLMAWARWFERRDNGRIVKHQHIGDVLVSTVFLGIDHNWLRTGPPVLWETMVFGGPLAGEMDRCPGSRADALAMHARMVRRVMEES
jgi:hypothetical protein